MSKVNLAVDEDIGSVALDDYIIVRDITDGINKKSTVDKLLSSRIGGNAGSVSNSVLLASGTGGKTLQAATNIIIDANGQMALGNLTANAMLDITCRASDVVGQKIKASYGQTANLVEINSYDGSGGDLFVVNYKGDVGITVVGGAPDEPLHVQSDFDGNRAIRMQNESEGIYAVARFIADTYGGSTYFTAYGSNFVTSGAKRANSGALIASGSMANGLSIVAKHTGASIRFYAGGNNDTHERIRILPNGNIGIGTISATAKLEIEGNIYPHTDNTYYLGKNDDGDTPLAWKGLILSDTTNGKHYRIEIINGVIIPTDLTD